MTHQELQEFGAKKAREVATAQGLPATVEDLGVIHRTAALIQSARSKAGERATAA